MTKFSSREEYEAWKAGRPGTDASGPVAAVPDTKPRSSLVTDAQAELTWGHDPKGVEKKLVEGGMSPKAAREVIADVQQSLSSEARRRGVIEVVLGLILCAVGVGWLFISGDPSELGFWQFLPTLVGLAILARGVARVATGSQGELTIRND